MLILHFQLKFSLKSLISCEKEGAHLELAPVARSDQLEPLVIYRLFFSGMKSYPSHFKGLFHKPWDKDSYQPTRISCAVSRGFWAWFRWWRRSFGGLEAPHPERLDTRKREPKVPSWLSVDWGATQGEKEGTPFRERVHIKPLEIENHRLKSAVKRAQVSSLEGIISVFLFPKKFVSVPVSLCIFNPLGLFPYIPTQTQWVNLQQPQQKETAFGKPQENWSPVRAWF